MTEYSQCGVPVDPVSIPDIAESEGAMFFDQLVGEGILGVEIAFCQIIIFSPAQQSDPVFGCPGQLQGRVFIDQKIIDLPGDFSAAPPVRVEKHDLEAVPDDIQGDLATADRAFDESGDEILGIVQQEPVAGRAR